MQVFYNNDGAPRFAIVKPSRACETIYDSDRFPELRDLSKVGMEVVVEYEVLVLGPRFLRLEEFDDVRQRRP